MKDLYYENQGTTTYLVYKIKENDQIDTMTLGMLTNNKIPGLVPTTFTQMDKDKYIKFVITSDVKLITPGLNRVLDNPFEIKIERIINAT